jgi:cardiolipin synthase (CMP-forming)
MRHIPNLLCLLRIASIWPLVIAMREAQHQLIILLFLFAAVSDGLDGYLAKRYNWTSDLGRFLDPLADKLLLVTVFITAAWLGIAPWWLTAAAVARDVMIGLGALVFRLWFGPLQGRPTIISKVNTGMQLAYLLAVVLAAATAFPPREVIDALAVVVLITIVLSGTDYVMRFTRRALHAP